MDRKEAAQEILRTVIGLYSKKPAMEVQNRSRGEAMVLQLVSLHPEGITPRQLREQMDVSSARIAAFWERWRPRECWSAGWTKRTAGGFRWF